MTKQITYTLVLSATLIGVVNAMMASPKNLEVEQCIEWSTSSQNSTNGMRGFRSISTKEVCTKTKTIILKQHGNAMQHWLTDDDGTCNMEI